jgi:branched-chain amino acid transport system permease protein
MNVRLRRLDSLAPRIAAVLVFGGLLLLPAFASNFALSNATFFLVSVPLVLGLVLLWGHCGILSFGQVAFFGIAGYSYAIIMANLADHSGWSMIATFSSLALVAAVSAIFGYFVFYGRVSGWITPILTLALTLVLELFLGQTSGYEWRIGKALLGGFNGMNVIPPLRLGGHPFSVSDDSLFLLSVALCACLFAGLEIFGRTRTGAVVRAVRDDAERAEVLGYDVRRIQVVVFVISALLAGLSGLLYVWWGNYIDPSSFGMVNATLPVIYVVVGGKESYLAAVIATLGLGYLADLLSVQGGQYAFVVNGALLLAAMLFFPAGIVRQAGLWVVPLLRRLPVALALQPKAPFQRFQERNRGPSHSAAAPEFKSGSAKRESSLLRVDSISKHFGGLSAVDELTLDVGFGEICCIVGPNGAGKSTLFNLICGRLRQDSGAIVFAGRNLDRYPPHERCRLGVGIKFQTTRVFNELSVHDNLAVAGSLELNGIARDLLATYNMSETDDLAASRLGPVQRQVLEIVMALRSGPQLLMLDEPTVGMTAPDVRALAQVFRALSAAGMTLLIIEHDMEFVREVAERIVVLHRGRYYAEGTVSEIEQHQGVREIYLGSA